MTTESQTRRTISTKAWTDAGYSFELWLRYAQASEEKQREVEKGFWKAHPQK